MNRVDCNGDDDGGRLGVKACGLSEYAVIDELGLVSTRIEKTKI